MSYSIYDSFLTIQDCKFYCKEVAKRLNLTTFDYFLDKHTQLQFPGDSNLYTFKDFQNYEPWRIRFNLTKPKTISKMGLDEYVSKNHELVFNLTIKGYSFIYVCKFHAKNQNETIKGYVDKQDNLYIEEPTGQLTMSFI